MSYSKIYDSIQSYITWYTVVIPYYSFYTISKIYYSGIRPSIFLIYFAYRLKNKTIIKQFTTPTLQKHIFQIKTHRPNRVHLKDKASPRRWMARGGRVGGESSSR